jgi:hypothetical protein
VRAIKDAGPMTKLSAVAVVAAMTLVLTASASAADGGVGSITGTVSSSAISVCVLVLDASGQSVTDAARTDATGRYTVDGVPAGAWTVEFVPDDGCIGQDTADAFQYYSNASTPAGATPVTVVAGETTSGIDATLIAGATIKGTVRDAGLTPLSGVCVVLEDTAGQPVLRQPTNPDGDYVLDQLPPGGFILQFIADDCVGQQPSYASNFYSGADTAASATVIDLHPGQLVGRIDEMLAPLPGAPTGGGGSTGPGPQPPTTGPPTTGSSTKGQRTPGAPTRPKAHEAVVSLAFAAGGTWVVDRRDRLHLKLRCAAAGGPACRTTITVRRVRRAHAHSLAGQVAGSLRVRIAAGKSKQVVVRLRGPRMARLWLSLRVAGRRQAAHTVIPVRWARTSSRSEAR